MVNVVELILDHWERLHDGIDSWVAKTFGEQAGAYFRTFAPFLTRAIAVIIYYMIGIGWYQRYEHWSVLDCAYFITVSLSTIGYGFLSPTNDQSRIFTCFYAIFGIAVFFEAISYVSRTVVLWGQTKLVDTISPSGSVYTRSSKRFIVSALFILIAVLIGTWFFAVIQSTWTTDMAFYWVIQTILTIGYGDLGSSVNDESKKFSIFFIIFVLIVFASAVQNAMDALSESTRFRTRQRLMQSSFADIQLQSENPVHKLTVDRNQYLIDTMIAMGLVDKVKDVDPILKVSNRFLSFGIKFDITNCGRITIRPQVGVRAMRLKML
jgi:hypothetical protein